LNPNEFITASWDDTRNSVTQWKIPDESTDEGNNPEPYMTNLSRSTIWLRRIIGKRSLVKKFQNYVGRPSVMET
jgi:hypothetical protein